MTKQDIITTLGIEPVNYTKSEIKQIVDEFRQLNENYDADQIWLKGDEVYWEDDNDKVDETDHLVAVEPKEDVAPNQKWVKFNRESFATEEDWKTVCEECDADPETTESVTIYFDDYTVVDGLDRGN